MTRLTRFSSSMALILAASIANAQEARFRVIVNPAVGVSTLTNAEVSQLFLKKKTTWQGGQIVQPVDQADSSAIRQAFTRSVLKKNVQAVNGYWQSQIFSGRAVPPPERGSDAAVLAYIAGNPGAIGYISSATALGPGAKEIKVN
jgi:ABC-type phosphate transport system substrate-binding protein